jgi:hypothetical protein
MEIQQNSTRQTAVYSSFTFTVFLQALHGSKAKFALQKQQKPLRGFFPRSFRHFPLALLT